MTRNATTPTRALRIHAEEEYAVIPLLQLAKAETAAAPRVARSPGTPSALHALLRPIATTTTPALRRLAFPASAFIHTTTPRFAVMATRALQATLVQAGHAGEQPLPARFRQLFPARILLLQELSSPPELVPVERVRILTTIQSATTETRALQSPA